MAFIVLLHAGFFWALSQGFVGQIIDLPQTSVVDFIPDTPKPQPAPPKPVDFEIQDMVFVPKPVVPTPTFTEDPETALVVNTVSDPPPAVDGPGSVLPPEPVVVEPRIGARGLSEPVYPPSEIRGEHEGTVLLSVLVLPNGRVGDVRIDRSSGYPKLDESAKREARLWRLTPGTRNGQPVQMWKQIPISFKLTNRD